MHLPSAATILALSSLGASYVVLPFMHANANLMRRDTPYKVVNVDGDNDQSKSSTSTSTTSTSSSSSADIQTTVQTVTASSSPPPPVTVTVTSTPSSTPLVSVSPVSPCSSSASSSSFSVSSSKMFSWNSIGTLSVLPTGTGFPSPRPSLYWVHYWARRAEKNQLQWNKRETRLGFKAGIHRRLKTPMINPRIRG